MKQRHVKWSFWMGFGLTVAVSFNQCGNVRFQEQSSLADGYALAANGNLIFRTTQSMTYQQRKALDIVWVVDNSGSMATEAAHVRTNFDAFVKSLENVPDVRLALINKTGNTGLSVQLPQTKIPTLNLDQEINSVNALQVLSAALCPKVAAPNSACAAADMAAATKKFPAVGGALASFLRKDSHKVFILITDDESSIPAARFKDVYESLYAEGSMTVFGWVGLGKTNSPCQAKDGLQYLGLAQLTGGEVNNVCDKDWAPKFSELSDNVVTLAYDTIALPADVVKARIVRVSLNGQVLSKDEYALSPTGLVLSAAARKDLVTAQIELEYSR